MLAYNMFHIREKKIIYFNRKGFTQLQSLPTPAPTETFDYSVLLYH